MNSPKQVDSPWLHRYCLVAALATLVLVGIGGVVTSKGAGMAVPDWPTSYGYNMFLLPFSHWVGGVFYEHTHRLVASVVGLLIVGLTRWLGGSPSRLPLAIIGALELVGGILLVKFTPDLRGTGHFLSGIGGVVLLAAAIWAKNKSAPAPLPVLGWVTFALVQFQGLLGGLRVVWMKDEIGIFHGVLAQMFFVLVCVIALLTSQWWRTAAASAITARPGLAWPALFATGLILLQLALGATMRHQHAGLAIPDFPLAYGKLWPQTDPASIAAYNYSRLEVLAANPITAFQVVLQMAHRLLALLIFAAVFHSGWQLRKTLGAGHPATKFAAGWCALICLQVTLGAVTIWSNKAADVATAHVLVGALSLALGVFVSIVTLRQTTSYRRSAELPLLASPRTAEG